MATGMAIMGFGGGAMVGAPLATALMSHFATPDSVGVWQSFLAMAAIYFVFMIGGALSYRVPPTGWKPEGWTAPAKKASNAMITNRHVHVNVAWKTPQFRLVWLVLCLNVSAGIGILGMASPLLQEVFGGKLLGNDHDLRSAGRVATGCDRCNRCRASPALLSLFNIGGRFFWASFSDYLGRKATYFVFFALGFLPCTRRFRRWAIWAALRCSWRRSASCCRCTAAVSRPCRLTSLTCSARKWLAPSMVVC